MSKIIFKITKFDYPPQFSNCDVPYLQLKTPSPANASTNHRTRNRFLLWPERYVIIIASHLETTGRTRIRLNRPPSENVRNNVKLLIPREGKRNSLLSTRHVHPSAKAPHPNDRTRKNRKHERRECFMNTDITSLRSLDYWIWRFTRHGNDGRMIRNNG